MKLSGVEYNWHRKTCQLMTNPSLLSKSCYQKNEPRMYIVNYVQDVYPALLDAVLMQRLGKPHPSTDGAIVFFNKKTQTNLSIAGF